MTRSWGFLLDDGSGGGTFSGGSFLASLFTDNGQLIIGASTHGFTVTTLTAGSGIGITNGPGSIQIYASGGGSSGAPIDASYVVMSANTSLSADRVLTGTTHQITVTDTGANGAAVLSLGITGISPIFFNGTSGQIGLSLGVTSPLFFTNNVIGYSSSVGTTAYVWAALSATSPIWFSGNSGIIGSSLGVTGPLYFTNNVIGYSSTIGNTASIWGALSSTGTIWYSGNSGIIGSSLGFTAPLFFTNNVVGYSSAVGSTSFIYGSISATSPIWFQSGIIGSSLGVTLGLFFTNNVLGLTGGISASFLSFGFTPGSILFAGVSGNISQDNPFLYFDYTNRSVRVGNNATIPIIFFGATFTPSIDIGNDTDTTKPPILSLTANGVESNVILFSRSNGTRNNPTIVTDQDTISSVIGLAYGASLYEPAAVMEYRVDGVVSSTFVPTSIFFSNTRQNGEVLRPMLVLDSDNFAKVQEGFVANDLGSSLPFFVKGTVSDQIFYVKTSSNGFGEFVSFFGGTTSIDGSKVYVQSIKTPSTLNTSGLGVASFFGPTFTSSVEYSNFLSTPYFASMTGGFTGYFTGFKSLMYPTEFGITLSNLYGYLAVLSKFSSSGTTGTVTAAHGFRVDVLPGIANVSEAAAFYVDPNLSSSFGSSFTYTIKAINTAPSILGGSLTVGSSANPQYTLDVYGSAQVSSSMLISSVTTSAILYTGTTGLVKQDSAFFSYDDAAKKLFSQNVNIRGLSANQITASGSSLDIINISVASPLYFSNSILGFSSALNSTTGIWRVLSATNSVWYSGNSGIIGSSLGVTFPLFFTNNILGFTFQIFGFTVGAILFAGTSGQITTDQANLWYDDTNNQLMFNSYGVSAWINSAINIRSKSDRVPISIRSYGPLDAPGLFFSHANGTESGPSLVSSGGIVHSLTGWAYNGLDYQLITNIRSEVDGTPGASTMAGRLSFNTKSSTLSNSSEVMRITSGGRVGINTTSPQATLDVEGGFYFHQSITDTGASFVHTFSDLFYQNNTFAEETTVIGSGFQSVVSSTQTGSTNTISNIGVYSAAKFSTGAGDKYSTVIGYAADVTNDIAGASCLNAACFYALAPNNAGLVGSYFGFLISPLNSNVNNSYGIYLDDQGTQYAIYSVGGKSVHYGRFTIGNVTGASNAILLVDQQQSGVTTACIDVNQANSTQPFIRYSGTSGAGASYSINTLTTPGSVQGWVKVNINGTDRWMPFYDNPS